MKRTHKERQIVALELLKASRWETSKAKRTGSFTEEEWQQHKTAAIGRLEDLIHGRKAS